MNERASRAACAPRIPSSKLPRVGTTIFTVMSQLAVKHGAVNLGQGFPDFNCDERLQARLADAVHAGHNQYAPMTGVPALREAIARKNMALYGHAYDVDAEITERTAPGLVFMSFHYREAAANLLTIDAIDPTAKIPEYKVCAVKVELSQAD